MLHALALALGASSVGGSRFGAGTAVALDFQRSDYGLNGSHVSDPSLLSGWSYTGSVSGTGSTVRTALNSAGAVVPFANGVPRITDLGLLIEEARTNALTFSQTFTNAAWSQVLGATATDNQVTAPNGTLTGATLTFNSTNGNRIENDSAVAAVDGATYTASAWLKGSGIINLNVSSTTGVGGSTETSITLTSTWTRYSVTWTASSPTGNVRAMIIWRTGNTATTLSAWGAQIETGAFATSYIPTTSAAATRAADVGSIGSLSIASPLTLFADVTLVGVNGVEQDLATLGTNTSNVIEITRAASNKMQAFASVAGATQYNVLTAGAVTSGRVKAAVSYDGNLYRSAINGGALAPSSAGVSAPPMTTLRIGDWIGGNNSLNNFVRAITIYSSAMSDAQLQALTQ